LLGPSGYSSTINGSPSFGIATAISANGFLGAVLYEPTPDRAHLNNRTAVLGLMCKSCGPFQAPCESSCFNLTKTGQGSYDPQSVAVSAHERNGGNRDPFFTVAATMGASSPDICFLSFSVFFVFILFFVLI
jgi:hypothetical protein